MDLFVTDDGTDRGSANHDLDRADPAASFHLREQHLCHHSFENEGELRPAPAIAGGTGRRRSFG